MDRDYSSESSQRPFAAPGVRGLCRGRAGVVFRTVRPVPSVMDVEPWGGVGPRVILVHGVQAAESTWFAQRPLADRMRLEVVVRPDHRAGALFRGGDYLRDADELAGLLAGEPAHLVGSGYGALACVVAAAQRPHRVESLTLIEPTCIGVLAHPAILDMCQRWWRERPQDLAEFAARFGRLAGLPIGVEFTAEHWDAVERLRECRPPWDARLPLEAIAQWGIPTQVYSGGHSPVLTAVAATVAAGAGGEHVELVGREHAVQTLGAPFNDRLQRHIDHAYQT